MLSTMERADAGGFCSLLYRQHLEQYLMTYLYMFEHVEYSYSHCFNVFAYSNICDTSGFFFCFYNFIEV